MLNELIERLAIKLAKADGWILTSVKDLTTSNTLDLADSDHNVLKPLDTKNARHRMYLKRASECLEEINNFLQDEEIDFDDIDFNNLELSAKYEV